MDFPPYNFNLLGETDVREEIIAPLLRHLGYRSGTLHNVVREQHLSYPQLALGRRKPHDPYLRGKADYICEAAGLVKWVIEAKAPGEELDGLVEEQAWSYANHQEIRAVYFVLTNGHKFKLYQTNRGAGAPPLFECTYAEMSIKLTAIESLLSPDAILKAHPSQVIDTGEPIGPGLRSIVRITSGQIQFLKLSAPVPPLQEMIMTVSDGVVERNEDGVLEAHLWTLVPVKSLQELNQNLGLDQMWLVSTSKSVSTDPDQLTVFESDRRVILPKGMVVLNMMDWTENELPLNVNAVVRTRATGHLADTIFTGSFFASITYLEFGMTLSLDGTFNLQLA
jgi:hypothetical protein